MLSRYTSEVEQREEEERERHAYYQDSCYAYST